MKKALLVLVLALTAGCATPADCDWCGNWQTGYLNEPLPSW